VIADNVRNSDYRASNKLIVVHTGRNRISLIDKCVFEAYLEDKDSDGSWKTDPWADKRVRSTTSK